MSYETTENKVMKKDNFGAQHRPWTEHTARPRTINKLKLTCIVLCQHFGLSTTIDKQF